MKVEKGGSAVEVSAGGRLHLLDEKTGATLTTDATGKLTIAILATGGLACPNLVVSGDGLTSSVEDRTVRHSGGVHNYLSGNGTLNPTNPGGPLPTFDAHGDTLAQAKVGGRPLAPGASDSELAATAAAAIQRAAAHALGKTPSDVRGFGGSLRKDHPSFEVFHTEEALQGHLAAAGLFRAEGFLDDLWDFFGDIFEGIKNAVIAIAHFVVDVARAVVTLTLTIAKWTAEAFKLPIGGIEKAANFMNGVFNAVDADIDKVADWLKALFDFRAIWRTKMAIQQELEKFPPYVKQFAVQSQKVTDGWFGKQKKSVNDAFDAAIKTYAGQTFGQQKNWQDPCAASSSNQIAGGAAPSDFTDNAHHNWLHDKVNSYPPDTSALRPGTPIDDLWKTVATHLQDSGKEFQKAQRGSKMRCGRLSKIPPVSQARPFRT